MIPIGWHEKRIGNLGKVQAGRQRSPHFTKGKLWPYLRVANVFDGYIDTSDVLEMNFTDEECETYRLEFGDILLNEGQSLELVGRSAMYRGDPSHCCFQNTLIRFKAGPDIDNDFALNLFRFLMYSGRFASIATQTTSVAHLGVSRFANMAILLPSLAEQRKIAAILGTWDAAIATAERLVAALRERKKGLMQRLLMGEVRFLEFVKSTETKKTQLGEIPLDWGEGSVQQLSLVNTENAETNPEKEWYYIDLSMVDQGTINFPKEKRKYKELPSRAQRVLHRNDIIMATVRPNLQSYALTEFEPVDVVCSTGFAIISPYLASDATFIYQSLYSPIVQRQIDDLVTGSNYR